jgi:hypothetical protein
LETPNDPLFSTPHPSNALAQTNSNETPDLSPDKTGNNREIELEELNPDWTTVPIQESEKLV